MKKITFLLFALFLIVQVSKAQDTTLWANVDVTAVSGAGVCDGSAEAFVYGGVPPYAYTWSTGATTLTVTDLCAGTYTFVVTDSEGYSFTVSFEVTYAGGGDIYGCMDPMALNYNPDATIDDGSCVYDTVGYYIFGCTDPYSINYNPYATIDDGSCIYDSLPGSDIYGCTDPLALNYNVNATISDGSCVYDFSEYIIDSCMSEIDSAWIDSYELIDSSTLVVTWSYYLDGAWETMTVTYTIDSDGLYYIMLIINCDEAKASQQIFVDIVNVDYNSITGISEPNNEFKFNAWPNPTNGLLNIELGEINGDFSIQLINTTGQICRTISKIAGENVLMNLENLPKGMYYLKISSSNNTKTSKIVLQ